MVCYLMDGGNLTLAQDPIRGADEESNDYIQALWNAGYRRELTSRPGDEWDAEITLYSSMEPGKPRFYLDVSGANGQIAVLLANSFLDLLKVLKEIEPLQTLFSLDQKREIFSLANLSNHPGN